MDIPLQPADGPGERRSRFCFARRAREKVTGRFDWADDSRSFTFTVDELLARDSTYRLLLGQEALAQGGTPLSETWDVEVYSGRILRVAVPIPLKTGILAEYLAGNITFTTAGRSGKDLGRNYLSHQGHNVTNFLPAEWFHGEMDGS